MSYDSNRHERRKARSRQVATAAAAVAPVVEGLENRLLLSFTVSDKGTLVIDGTSGDDTIFVMRNTRRASRLTVSINGVADTVSVGTVRRVEIYGGAGNDDLRVDDSAGPSTAQGATISGGDGADTLVGSLRSISLDGGLGDDVLYGSSKTDDLVGGDGNDTVFAGKGNDRVFGGLGDDSLTGWLGHDLMYGDQGNDTLEGEGGNDTLAGDGEDRLVFQGDAAPVDFGGNDSLDGGTGNDWLVGGKQSNTLDDDNGTDTLRGGSGDDILDARGNPGRGNPDDVLADRETGDIVPVEDHTRAATAAEQAAGDAAYVTHTHANLVVQIDDGGVTKDVIVQAGIGEFTDPNVANTGPAFHVHTGQEGRLHMHDLEPHVYTLGEFFRVWGVSMSADHIGRYVAGNGHTLTFTVDHDNAGPEAPVTIEDPYNYVIQGQNTFDTGDLITITYT
jgi:Ca2+-binding RTX toxin-like protein